jgi:hypothetical protein
VLSILIIAISFYVDNGKQLPLWRDFPHFIYWLLPLAALHYPSAFVASVGPKVCASTIKLTADIPPHPIEPDMMDRTQRDAVNAYKGLAACQSVRGGYRSQAESRRGFVSAQEQNRRPVRGYRWPCAALAVDRSGREIVLHVAGPGETLAEASLFSPQYHCDAIANIDATVRVYPKREVLTAFEEHPKAARAFTETLAHQVMNLRTRIEQRNIRSARERVRHFLTVNVGPDRRTVELRGTLKDLAVEIGLTHEALYRTLAALERSGEIR